MKRKTGYDTDMKEHVRERRKHRRLREHALIRFRLEQESTYQFGLCLDLSVGGMKVLSDQQKPCEARVIIHTHLAGKERVYHFSALGRVAWQKPAVEGKTLMGIEFLEIAEEDFQNLRDYLESREVLAPV